MRQSIGLRLRRILTLAVLVTVALCSGSESAAQMANFPEATLIPPALVTGESVVPSRKAVSAKTWKLFSSNLVSALQSDDDTYQAAAMRLTIQYAGYVDVDAAIFDLVRIFRDHESDNMRRMAVVAIDATDNKWGINLLERSFETEKSRAVKHTIGSVLMKRASEEAGPAKQIAAVPRNS